MPRLNGLVTCEKIRHMPGYADTQIVVFSGYDGDRERLAATAAGKDAQRVDDHGDDEHESL